MAYNEYIFVCVQLYDMITFTTLIADFYHEVRSKTVYLYLWNYPQCAR